VARPARTNSLERRKQVRVRLRPNLLFSARREEGRTVHVVSDPVTLQHFRLDERQRYAVGLMDGTHTLAEIQQACEERFRPERLPLEELEAFAAQLVGSGLALSESARAGPFLFDQWQKHRREALRSVLANFLYVKVPLWDPDAFLGRLAPPLGFLFGRAAALVAVLLALLALGLVVTRWHDFVARLPSYRDFFTASTLLDLWVALGAAKVLHELGHGLCCKKHGGTVSEMGVLVLVFCPTLYCNVSDSWGMPDKWRRMAIAAAGIYVDLFLAALATFLWWATDPAALLHHLCLAVMIVCGTGTLLWNANPLMRFDGYFLLSDWLEVPNLLERSSGYVRGLLLRWLGLDVPLEPIAGRGRRLLFVAYAVAGSAYRAVMLAGVIAFLHTFLEPYRLGSVGFLLAAAVVLGVVGPPLYGILRTVVARGRLPEMKPARLWFLLGGVVLLGGACCTMPLPLSVEGQALLQVEPDHVWRVAVPATGGFVRDVLVRDGQPVRTGDVLAVLTNPQLEIRLRLNEADQALRSQQLSGQVAYLSEAGQGGDLPGGTVQQIELEMRALVREQALLREQRDRLTLRAPAAGVVTGLADDGLKGRWLEKGTEVCRVADPNAVRALLLIGPADHELVGPGRSAWVRVHGRGSARWAGTVLDVAEADARTIPPQLSNHAGGEVATEQDPVSKAERPRSQHYLVAVHLREPGVEFQPGVLGRVKIEAAPQTVWWRVRWYLATTFGWGL
jgi:putative peptide zinc metalloprotease protein